MASVCFIGTYMPITCGIADYTHFITREYSGDWKVISFDLNTSGLKAAGERGFESDHVWYGIPGPENFAASDIVQGMRALGIKSTETVLWFQHEFGIWRNDERFVRMIRELRSPKIVTLHTLHFQSTETLSGLRRNEIGFLRSLLPHVDAITVFSRGIYQAVVSAFPHYWDKIVLLRHGIHLHPEISSLGREKAKARLNEFLLHESSLGDSSREALSVQHILTDPNYFVIGETGFLCPGKQSEVLFQLGDSLQQAVPGNRIVSMRIGAPRDPIQQAYASRLRSYTDNRRKFLIEAHLPEEMLRMAQRAFDLNLYWPRECSQSGILAHALGAGALIAGRDMEGSGEMLQMAGAITSTQMRSIIGSVRNLILHPEFGRVMEERAMAFVREISWKNQAGKHADLVEQLTGQAIRPAVAETIERALLGNVDRYVKTGVVSSLA